MLGNSKLEEELLQRFNKPLQGHANAARAFCHSEDPAIAWARLRKVGYCRVYFNGGQKRLFATDVGRESLSALTRLIEMPAPDSLSAVATIASDPEGMLEAETHAKEFIARLRPWGAIDDGIIYWYFSNKFSLNMFNSTPYNKMRDSISLCGLKHGVDIQEFAMLRIDRRLPSEMRFAIPAIQFWAVAARNDLAADSDDNGVRGATFADLQCPFEPLIKLWLTGYQISPFLSTRDPYFRLYSRLIECD